MKLTTVPSTKPQIYRMTALKLIRANAGFETLTDRKIYRWMNALGIKKSASRPVGNHFESDDDFELKYKGPNN
jgi:hypothetical protein